MTNLFKETKLEKITVKKRFVRSSTWENMTTADSHITDKLYKIYGDLVAGGIGLIITGYANVVKEG
ncbi:MAG: hypothetical protein ACERKN_10570 [Velocimicrobium sp.]